MFRRMQSAALQGLLMLLTVLCLWLLCGMQAQAETAVSGTVSGYAWLDEDGGAQTESHESRLSGVAVRLIRWDGEQRAQTLSAVTDAQGYYCFANLPNGEYQLCADDNGLDYLAMPIQTAELVDGYAATSRFVMDASHRDAAYDVAVLPCRGLSCSAYVDGNGDGVRAKYDRDLTGLQLTVLLNGQPLYGTHTDNKGGCMLPIPEHAEIQVTLPNGYMYSAAGSDNDIAGTQETAVLQPDGMEVLRIAAVKVGSLSGTAFEDVNNNGIWDEGEPGVPGITVTLKGVKNSFMQQAVTDENGCYCFTNLTDGTYRITADLPDGLLFARYSKTGGDLRSIFSGETLERDFKIRQSGDLIDKNIGVIQKGVIQGTAFLDLNYNGLWDEGEPGYAGVTVEATRFHADAPSGKTVTNEMGAYAVENLRGGNYRVRAILPKGDAIFSTTAAGAASEANLFEQRAGRREFTVQPVTIASGESTTVLVGVAIGATVSGVLFEDENYNGIYDRGEKTLSGLEVSLVREDGSVAAAVSSGAKGVYRLADIMPGDYRLQVQRKRGYGFTRMRAEQNGGSVVAALVDEVGLSEPFAVQMGENVQHVNAGMLPAATVSGKLFNDANDDGAYDALEGGLTTAVVRMVSEDAEADVTAAVQPDGSFAFDGLMPGQYTLRYELAPYCEMRPEYSQEISLKIKMGEAVVLQDAAAVTLGSFCGRVVAANGGQGIAGATVAIGEHSVQTKADGSFRIENIRPDHYNLTVTLPQPYIFANSSDAFGLQWPADNTATQPIAWETLISRGDMVLQAVRAAAVRGVVWMDENTDRLRGEDEWIMEGLSVELWADDADSPAASVLTDSNGFAFEQVRPGAYSVRFMLPEQCTPANDAEATFRQSGNSMVHSGLQVAEGGVTDGLTTGLVSTTSIGGTVILEQNGMRETVSGAMLDLLCDGRVLATTVSDEEGHYRFDGLWPNTYTVRCHQPKGLVFVRSDDPNYANETLFLTELTDVAGISRPVALKMAQHELMHDILLIKPGKVGDQAWLDSNGNGLIDAGEPLLCGITVKLLSGRTVCYETQTDEQGYYLFADVYPGTYVLQAEGYEQLMPTQQVAALRMISTCLTSGTGTLAQSDSFDVVSGSINGDYDLGYVLQEGQTLPQEAYANPQRDWSSLHDNTVDGLV